MLFAALDPAFDFAALRDPVTLPGAFTLWARVSLFPTGDALAFAVGSKTERNNVSIDNGNIAIAVGENGPTLSSPDGATVPSNAVTLVRVRRDAAGVFYVAWSGRAEAECVGGPATDALTFDLVGATGIDRQYPGHNLPGCRVLEVAIHDGELTAEGRATIESATFGQVL